MAAVEIIVDDAEIVFRSVREIRATGALSGGPHIGRGGFQAIVHSDVAVVADFDSRSLEANSHSVWRASKSNENIGPFLLFRASFRSQLETYVLSRNTIDAQNIAV